MKFIVLLIIAFFCGSIGAQLAGAKKEGCFINIVLGYVGAIVGGWLSRKLHMSDIIVVYGIPVIWSIIGAAIFVAIISMMTGGSKK